MKLTKLQLVKLLEANLKEGGASSSWGKSTGKSSSQEFMDKLYKAKEADDKKKMAQLASMLGTSSDVLRKVASGEDESFTKIILKTPFRYAGDVIYYGSFDKATKRMDQRFDRKIKGTSKKLGKETGKLVRKAYENNKEEINAAIQVAMKSQIEVPSKLNRGGLILLKYIFKHLPDIAHEIEKKSEYKKTGFGSIGYSVKYNKGFDFKLGAIIRNKKLGIEENVLLFKFSLGKFIENLDKGAEQAAITAGVPKSIRDIIKKKIDRSAVSAFNKLWPPNLDIRPIKIFKDNSGKIESSAKAAGDWIKEKIDPNPEILTGLLVWDELLDADSALRLQSKKTEKWAIKILDVAAGIVGTFVKSWGGAIIDASTDFTAEKLNIASKKFKKSVKSYGKKKLNKTISDKTKDYKTKGKAALDVADKASDTFTRALKPFKDTGKKIKTSLAKDGKKKKSLKEQIKEQAQAEDMPGFELASKIILAFIQSANQGIMLAQYHPNEEIASSLVNIFTNIKNDIRWLTQAKPSQYMTFSANPDMSDQVRYLNLAESVIENILDIDTHLGWEYGIKKPAGMNKAIGRFYIDFDKSFKRRWFTSQTDQKKQEWFDWLGGDL